MISRFIFVFFLIIYASNVFCGLVSETKIVTAANQIEIKDLKIGDFITGYDPDNQSFPEVEIKNITSSLSTYVCLVKTEKGLLYVSKDQLFYDVILNDFVKAENLSSQNVFVTRDLKECKCLGVAVCDYSTTFYDLTLVKPHLFFASEEAQILMHNMVLPSLMKICETMIAGAIACVYLSKPSPILKNLDAVKKQIHDDLSYFFRKIELYGKEKTDKDPYVGNYRISVSYPSTTPTIAGIKIGQNFQHEMRLFPLRYGPFCPVGILTKSGDVMCTLHVLKYQDHKNGVNHWGWDSLGSSTLRRNDPFVKLFIEAEDKKQLDSFRTLTKKWPPLTSTQIFKSKIDIQEESNCLRSKGCFELDIYGVTFGIPAIYHMIAKNIAPSRVLQAMTYGKSIQSHHPERIICQYPLDNLAVLIPKGCGGRIIDVGFYNADMKSLNPPPTQEEKESRAEIVKVLEGTTPGRETSGDSKQFEKTGNIADLAKDFNSMKLKNIKHYPNGTITGELPDGKIVNIRKQSTDSRPTLEIFDPKTKKKIKIRYGEKL